jgi:hypothetical protein
MKMQAVNILIAVALAALRIAGHKSEAFQAAAHLFVGGLLTAGWVADKSRFWPSTWKFYTWLAIALSVVEVACFIWFKFFT